MFTEGAVLGWSMEERLSKCEEIQKIMIRSGFPCYMKGLEEVGSFEFDKYTLTQSVSTEQMSVLGNKVYVCYQTALKITYAIFV